MLITPAALARSKCIRKVTVTELKNPDATHDHAWVYIFPTGDPLDEINGDGRLEEIISWRDDLSAVYFGTGRGSEMATTPETEIYVRDD